MSSLIGESSYFGLDIGATAVRLVQLKRFGGKASLVTYGAAPLPEGMFMSDATADSAQLGAIIKQLIKDTRVSTRNVVMGLPSSKVFATVIATPKLTHNELAKSIPYQADQYVPMALDQVKLDWVLLGPGPTSDEQEVLLIAAPNLAAKKYLEIAEQANLEILALEVNATAVERALMGSRATGAAMLLDLGTMATDITISYAGSPRLIRSIPVGGMVLTKTVAQGLGLPADQAEQFIQRFGLTKDKLEGQVHKAIKAGIDQLIGEIQKSAKFFSSRYANVKLEKLVVTGGMAALPGLAAALADSTGLPVESGNAWLNVSYPSGLQQELTGLAGTFATASGLALRSYI